MVYFSVIMPTYNQATFIRRAISSLLKQTYPYWELIIINDGSTDNTDDFIKDFMSDVRIKYIKCTDNQGFGSAINKGLDKAKYEYISYLPSDDYYYPNHLEVLKDELQKKDVILTFAKSRSGMKDSTSYNIKKYSGNLFNKHSLQLVQTAHVKTEDRWVTRDELVSFDLYELFWCKLIKRGVFTSIKKETSHWTTHCFQHSRLINESLGGGLNTHRQYYNIKKPIKIRLLDSKIIDEKQLYKNFRTPQIKKNNNLKILIVGELSHHPDKIYALEEHGHELYGLWIYENIRGFNSVGPIPFGNVTDIPYDNWENKIEEIKPDIIYGALNHNAIPLAYEVMMKKPDIPFVWHFKESPVVCRNNDSWNKLIELYNYADGKIYINKEAEEWYEQFIYKPGLSYILEGDLPKKEYFTDDFSPLLSEKDGEIHTLISGRIIGFSFDVIKALTDAGIHIHSYSNQIPFSRKAASLTMNNRFHVHSTCPQDCWVKEFSQYDAGWLHYFDSTNNGNIFDVGWDDLNLPARMGTLAAAGLPMIQKRNTGHIVAMKSIAEKNNIGIFFDTFEELAVQLRDKKHMASIRENVIQNRKVFCFDYHVADLIDFFKKVIKEKKEKPRYV